MNNNLLALLFIVGGIYLIKEYLVAVRIMFEGISEKQEFVNFI